MDNHKLKQRTRDRNKAVWKKINFFDYMGMKDILSNQRGTLDTVNLPSINNPITIVDDAYRIKEEQLNKTIALRYDQIKNEKTIADEKAINQRKIMALTEEGNNYVLLVEDYITQVRDAIMDAKILAQKIVAAKEIEYQSTRLDVAEKRADAQLKELDIKILLEEINKKYVEIEILRAQLDVARAHIRVALSLIAEKEAEIREIQTKIEMAMAEVTRAELKAQIALIAADIVVRKLTETRYEIEKNEIEQAFNRITDKLNAILDLIAARKKQQVVREGIENDLLSGIADYLVAQKEEEKARKEGAQADERVQDYEKAQIPVYLEEERMQRDLSKDKQIETIHTRTDADITLNRERVTVQELIDAAYKWAAKNIGYIRSSVSADITHRISG